jgi:hypothetical protein
LKTISSFEDFIETNFNLEEEFEGAFERDKVVELKILNKCITSFHTFLVIFKFKKLL